MLTQTNGVINKPLVQWHSTIAAIIDQGINDKSIGHLVNTIRLMVDGCCCNLMTYPKSSQPSCFFTKQHPERNQIPHLDQYLQGAYLLNPFYLLSIDRSVEGVYSLAEVAPYGFQQSEFYRIYYQQVNFGDEICLIIPTPDNASIQISISRKKGTTPFTEAQRELCQRIFSTVRAILLKWWNSSQKIKQEGFLKTLLDDVLINFGSSILTPREAQVLQMILRGYAIRLIARKLDISPETIKHHRKNIYAKLDVSSQGEVFHLFIDSLRMITPNSPPDPLTNYLQVASRA